MNEHDAQLYAEEKGLMDGYNLNWEPPFRMSYCADIAEIYQNSYWYGFETAIIEEEFPNG